MSWYFENGKDSDVVVSTRIRLARNVKDIKFNGQMNEKDEEKLLSLFEKNQIGDLNLFKLSNLDDITKLSLVEKHILSRDFLRKERAAFLVNDEENICVMINEEDHIRIQAIKSGFDLDMAYKMATKIDDDISKNIEYAYSSKYGYLTTCPTNLGTGLRASVMLHLPALRITGRIQKILDVVNKVNVAVRGVYGEGTDSIGDMYQVSNKISLGVSDEEIINNIKKISETIIKKEREAREVLKLRGIDFEDKISRMYGTFIYARKMSYSECAKLLSEIKLGVDMGIIKDISLEKINKIRILAKVASLQKYYKKELDSVERDIKRAELVKEILKT